MADIIKLKRDTQANWNNAEALVLKEGEVGIITDAVPVEIYIGDGTKPISHLSPHWLSNIKGIKLNGTSSTPDNSGIVTLNETDPRVAAWATSESLNITTSQITDLSDYTGLTGYTQNAGVGSDISSSFSTNDQSLTITLKNSSGNTLKSSTVTIPISGIESGAVVGDNLELYLVNGGTVTVPLGSLVSGLTPMTRTIAGISLQSDIPRGTLFNTLSTQSKSTPIASASCAANANHATSATNANYATSAGSATSATTATKLSTSAGATTTPVYFSGGQPVACTAYANATVSQATTATKLGSSTVGGTTQPIYLSGGQPQAITTTLGASNKPVYLNGGVFTTCDTYPEGVSVDGLNTWSSSAKTSITNLETGVTNLNTWSGSINGKTSSWDGAATWQSRSQSLYDNVSGKVTGSSGSWDGVVTGAVRLITYATSSGNMPGNYIAYTRQNSAGSQVMSYVWLSYVTASYDEDGNNIKGTYASTMSLDSTSKKLSLYNKNSIEIASVTIPASGVTALSWTGNTGTTASSSLGYTIDGTVNSLAITGLNTNNIAAVNVSASSVTASRLKMEGSGSIRLMSGTLIGGALHPANISSSGYISSSAIRSVGTITAVGNISSSADIYGANVRATGEVVPGYASDRRLKKNIVPIENTSDVLSNLKPVEFDWNEKAEELSGNSRTGHARGFIADEFLKTLPNAGRKMWGKYDAIYYEQVIPYLVAGYQQQQQEIDALKQEIKELKESIIQKD